jgi:hypothetical protein
MEATASWTEKAEAVLGGQLSLPLDDLLAFARSGSMTSLMSAERSASSD